MAKESCNIGASSSSSASPSSSSSSAAADGVDPCQPQKILHLHPSQGKDGSHHAAIAVRGIDLVSALADKSFSFPSGKQGSALAAPADRKDASTGEGSLAVYSSPSAIACAERATQGSAPLDCREASNGKDSTAMDSSPSISSQVERIKQGSVSIDCKDASKGKGFIATTAYSPFYSSANAPVDRSKPGLVSQDCKEASKGNVSVAMASYCSFASSASSASAPVERISALSKKRSATSDEASLDSIDSGKAERSLIPTLSAEKASILSAKACEQSAMVCVLNSQDSSVVMDIAQVSFMCRKEDIAQPALAEIVEEEDEEGKYEEEEQDVDDDDDDDDDDEDEAEEQTVLPSISIKASSFHLRSDPMAVDQTASVASSSRTSDGSNASTKTLSFHPTSNALGTDRASMASVLTPEDLTVVPTVRSSDQATVKRCFTCRKRTGLLGFKCRCGDIFCALHRHSVKHNCPFDYKAAGKEAIAKANPLIRASKIQRI